jgi:hypothetical protein
MADFEFSRDNSGNYQATICPAGRRVTIQLYGGKVYVDIRDYFTKDCFAKDSAFLPTKRGITLTKFEWQQLFEHSEQTGTDVVRVYQELDTDDEVKLPDQVMISEEVSQAVRLFKSANAFGPTQLVRIVLYKSKESNKQVKPRELEFTPMHWYNLVIRNRERINELIDLLEKEASLSAGKRKQDALAAERSLFQATWSIPALQQEEEDQQ